jgi:hypothetical protein
VSMSSITAATQPMMVEDDHIRLARGAREQRAEDAATLGLVAVADVEHGPAAVRRRRNALKQRRRRGEHHGEPNVDLARLVLQQLADRVRRQTGTRDFLDGRVDDGPVGRRSDRDRRRSDSNTSRPRRHHGSTRSRGIAAVLLIALF